MFHCFSKPCSKHNPQIQSLYHAYADDSVIGVFQTHPTSYWLNHLVYEILHLWEIFFLLFFMLNYEDTYFFLNKSRQSLFMIRSNFSTRKLLVMSIVLFFFTSEILVE